MQRPLALVLCIAGLLLLVAGAAGVVVPPFLEEFSLLLQKLPEAGQTLVRMGVDWIDTISEAIYGTDAFPDIDELELNGPRQLVPDGSSLAAGVGSGLLGLLGLAGNLGNGLLRLLFVLAVALMISIQPQAYRNVGLQLIPSFYRRRGRRILDQCGAALSSWMVGVLISSVAVGFMAFVGLSLLGVKLTTANALLAGMLNVIPNVGPTLSVVFPMAVALLDTPWMSLAVLALYVVIQNFESYVITPSVMHHQVKLLPGLTLAAQGIFTVIFGFKGLLLALPLAVCLQVVVRELVVRDVLDTWKRPGRFC